MASVCFWPGRCCKAALLMSIRVNAILSLLVAQCSWGYLKSTLHPELKHGQKILDNASHVWALQSKLPTQIRCPLKLCHAGPASSSSRKPLPEVLKQLDRKLLGSLNGVDVLYVWEFYVGLSSCMGFLPSPAEDCSICLRRAMLHQPGL